MWFLMGQLDLTSLTLLRGSEAGGEYAPTMRAFEAMNALGLAVAFVSIRALAGAPAEVAVRRIKRILPPSLALYAVLTIPLLLLGHRVLDRLLGEGVFWSTPAVIALAIGYGGNLIMALCFETLASQRHTGLLLRVAIQISVLALLMTPILVALFGLAGAALGNAISYSVGGVLAYLSLGRLAPARVEARCAS
jgi:O-antigen/teichoic acid export membrane protein